MLFFFSSYYLHWIYSDPPNRQRIKLLKSLPEQPKQRHAWSQPPVSQTGFALKGIWQQNWGLHLWVWGSAVKPYWWTAQKKSWIRSYKALNHSKLKYHETQSISGKAFPYRLLEKIKPSAYSKINPDEIKWNGIVFHEITRIALQCCKAVFCKLLCSGLCDSGWKLQIYHHQQGPKIII